MLIRCLQSITHPIEMLNLFEQIDVAFPPMYADVTNALADVEKKLDFFRNLTR
jgi:hypothetical protein